MIQKKKKKKEGISVIKTCEIRTQKFGGKKKKHFQTSKVKTIALVTWKKKKKKVEIQRIRKLISQENFDDIYKKKRHLPGIT